MAAAGDGGGRVDRFIHGIELTAAIFLAAVTAVTFVQVFLRYIFVWSIPDAYDVSSMLLGILIFWGIAGASYRGDHITVDLLWTAMPPVVQRAMDVFADLVTLASLAVFTWMMATKVATTYGDNVQTFDLRMPVWGFYLVAWAGLAAAIALMVVRTIRLLLAPETLARKSPAEMID